MKALRIKAFGRSNDLLEAFSFCNFKTSSVTPIWVEPSCAHLNHAIDGQCASDGIHQIQKNLFLRIHKTPTILLVLYPF